MPLTIDIDTNSGWPEGSAAIVERAAMAAFSQAAGSEAAPGEVELSVLLTDNATIRDLNREWRGKDGPTNVLAFSTDGPIAEGAPRLLGDIALARETVEREAVEQDKPFSRHLAHLTVHGLLHLLGHDHRSAGDAETMETCEIDILSTLGIPNPYAENRSFS